MNAGAYAMGRKADELIVAAASASTTTADDTSNGATLAWATTLMVTAGNNDWPDDGERYAIIGWAQWGKLMALQQFIQRTLFLVTHTRAEWILQAAHKPASLDRQAGQALAEHIQVDSLTRVYRDFHCFEL